MQAVANDGPGKALDVAVTDTLPSDVSFVSTTGCAKGREYIGPDHP